MEKHKYLEEIIDIRDIIQNWNLTDERQEQWKKEKEEYGFDERETWSMDTAFFQWLYERLRMYKEISAVDLEYHKFDVNGEELTQKQIIDRLIDLISLQLKNSLWEGEDHSDEICNLWRIVCPAMWW